MAKSSDTMGQKKIDRISRIAYITTDLMNQQARERHNFANTRYENPIPPSDNVDKKEDLSELDSITSYDSLPLRRLNLKSQSNLQNEENENRSSQPTKQVCDTYNNAITPDTKDRRVEDMEPYDIAWEPPKSLHLAQSSYEFSPKRRVHPGDRYFATSEIQTTPIPNSKSEETYPHHYFVSPETNFNAEDRSRPYNTDYWSQHQWHEEERHFQAYYRGRHNLMDMDSRGKKYEDYERYSRDNMQGEMVPSYYPTMVDTTTTTTPPPPITTITPRKCKKFFAARATTARRMSDKHPYATSNVVDMPKTKQPYYVEKPKHVMESESRDVRNLRPYENIKMEAKQTQINLPQGIINKKKTLTHRKLASKANNNNNNSGTTNESWISESDITENDVICERGGKSNRHAGTKKYRGIVEKLKTRYQNLILKREKTDLSREIIAQIHESNGRFLKKDDDSGLYFVLSKVETTKKVSQALREKKALKWTEDADE
jgi:hypothetical protein